ncbi:MAG: sigma-70 family RNA polymerase sigma factor [Deltaproteobacteria bacterium]|nr:sigma-70 family RNA polymerase sigma factor [Deltaproteobacteria bacterium]
MTTGTRAEQFVSLVLTHQRRLHAFIRALVPESPDVDDLFQQTSTVLWRRFDDYQPGTNFAAWAMTIARNQVRDHRKSHLRRRGVFSDDLFDAIADKIAIATETVDARQEALLACLRELPADARQLIELRYTQEQPVETIAATLRRSDKTVYRLLAQIRSALLSCVENRMRAETSAAGPKS